MNKQRKTSHILNVFQYDADGHVVLPASLTLGIVPGAEDNSGKVPSTAWVRGLVSTTGSSLVPTNRSITINGTSYDLSSNRSWSIDTGVLTASAGSGISVSVVNQNLNIVNTGLLTGTAGAGISVSTVNQNLNIVNTGLLTGTAGAGISVSTVNQNLNIVNTGLLTASSGLGISVTTVGQNLNIVNTGILTASAGSGVSVSVVGQNLNIVNSGILTATAGAGISLSVVSGNLNIVNTITNNNQLDNGAGYATTSYVSTQINNLVAGAPGLLDTLDELAAALGDDPSFATTVTTSIATKVPQTRTITINGTSYDLSANRSWTINSMVYPSAGIAVSTGTAWGTSITDNSSNWNTAFGWGNHASAGYLTTSSAASTYASLTGSYANPSWITSLAYSKLTGVPSTFTPSSHTHAISEVTGLQTALDGKQASLGFTPYNATNPSGYITGITSSMVTTALGYTPYNAAGNIVLTNVNYTSYALRWNSTQAPANGLDNTSIVPNSVTLFDGYGAPIPGYPSGAAQWWVGALTIGDANRGFQIAGGYADNDMYFRKGNSTWSTWRRVWTDVNLTNLNQLTNGPGYITGYTETDTLASVTARGASTSTNSVFTGGLQARRNQSDNNYTTAALWTESYGSTTTGIAFHISGVVGKFLEMRTNGVLYWENNQVVTNTGTWGISITGNAATLGGYGPNQTGGAYTIVQRDSNGYIQNSYFYTSGGGSERGTGISYIAGFNSSDYYIRSYTLQGLASAMSGATMNISGNSSTTSQRDFSGDISTSGMGRFTGWYTGNAATGLAAEIGISAGQAYIIAYNRQTSTYGTLNLEGSASTLRLSGSTVNVVTGALQQGGNQVLHAGNVGSYAVTSLTDTLASVTSRGSSTSSTLTSTNTLGLYVNSGGASYIGINSTSNWSYVSHLNNGTTTWDVGAFNGGQYEIRPYGGSSNRVTVQLNGQFSVNNSQNQVALFQSPNGNTWVDIVSNAGTWSMGAASNNRWALYNRGGSEGVRFEVSTSDAWVNGNTVLHAGNYGSYALTSNSDSEQQVGLRYLYWNEGARRMNTDPRWNESGYDTDLGCLHIWSWTAGGVAYGRAGIALYNGSAYQYLTTQSGQSNIYVNNNPIIHGGNIGSQSVNYASYALYLNAVNNYSWSASSGSTSFHQGISSSFVSSNEGFPSYGSVMTMRTYSGGGGTLQLYTPYSYAYGGNRLGFRFSDYVTGTWTGWRYLLNDSTDPYAANMNQDVRTDSGPTFANVYNNGWFRNNGVNVGLYNQAVDTHFYSSSTGEWNFATSNGSWTQINLRPGGHNSAVRGCFYADTGNNVGILNNAGSWGIRLDSARHSYMYGNLTVGLTTNASSIYMSDGDEGAREIHCNSNRIGFLNQSSSWGAWCDDSGNWLTGAGVYAGIFYDYDNGGYYLDPNSTSNLLHIQMPHRGNGTPNILVNNGGSENWGAIHIEGGSGNLRIGKSDAGRSWSGRVSLAMHVGASESFRVHSDGWDSLFEVWGSSGYARLKGSLEVGSDVYLGTRGTWLSSWLNQNVTTGASPSFSEVTAGYHRSYYLTGRYDVSVDHTYGIYFSSYVDYSYAIFRESGAWNHPYPDLRIAFHTGIKIGAYYGYNGTRFYNNSDMATITASVNDGDNNFRGYYDIIAYASDKRLKENIKVIDNAVDKVKQLTGMTYTWNRLGTQYGWTPSNEREAGVFAQDVQAVLPEAVKLAPFDNSMGVSKSGENFLTVKYEKIVPLLIEAIKEQQNQIEELQNKLDNVLSSR